MFAALRDYAIPKLYRDFELGNRPVKGDEADTFLTAANLNSLPPIFYDGEDALNLVVKQSGKAVPNLNAEICRKVMDYLARRVLKALEIMLGNDAARDVVSEPTGRDGQPEEELRRYFSGPFFREHIQKYCKRPVYWLLQSPRKKYGIWLFHERLTVDTLFRIRGDEYVGSKLRLFDANIMELRRRHESAEGRERRRLEKEIAEIEELRDDVQAFADRIDAILARGYTPHIDDGVLINMAALWELMPMRQCEPKK